MLSKPQACYEVQRRVNQNHRRVIESGDVLSNPETCYQTHRHLTGSSNVLTHPEMCHKLQKRVTKSSGVLYIPEACYRTHTLHTGLSVCCNLDAGCQQAPWPSPAPRGPNTHACCDLNPKYPPWQCYDSPRLRLALTLVHIDISLSNAEYWSTTYCSRAHVTRKCVTETEVWKDLCWRFVCRFISWQSVHTFVCLSVYLFISSLLIYQRIMCGYAVA